MYVANVFNIRTISRYFTSCEISGIPVQRSSSWLVFSRPIPYYFEWMLIKLGNEFYSYLVNLFVLRVSKFSRLNLPQFSLYGYFATLAPAWWTDVKIYRVTTAIVSFSVAVFPYLSVHLYFVKNGHSRLVTQFNNVGTV